jgi:phage-related protein
LAHSRIPLIKGVEEIRVPDSSGIYRVVYAARLSDAIYVPHAVQKKTQASKRDRATARERFAQHRMEPR